MKRYILLLLLAGPVFAAEWSDEKLPLADPDKPVFQWAGWKPPWGLWLTGRCFPVRIGDIKDYKEQLELDHQRKIQDMKLAHDQKLQDDKLKQIARGNNLMLAGVAVCVLAFLVHACTAAPPVKRICEYALAGGVSSVIVGIVYKFIISNEVALMWCIGVLGGIGVAWYILSHPRIKDWSVSHMFTKRG